jgi:hypothetical protein
MTTKLDRKRGRREAEDRRRAQVKRSKRNSTLVTVAISVVVIIVVIVSVIAAKTGSVKDVSGPNGVSASEANCSRVSTVDALEAEHIDTGESHVPYNTSPPSSGPHYVVPAELGFYRDGLAPEQVVHNLEHGAVAFWFSPNAPMQVVSDLQKVVEGNPQGTLGTLFEGSIEGGRTFAMTAWTADPDDKKDPGFGHVQACDAVSVEVVNSFLQKYQGKSPEDLTPEFIN